MEGFTDLLIILLLLCLFLVAPSLGDSGSDAVLSNELPLSDLPPDERLLLLPPCFLGTGAGVFSLPSLGG